MITRAAARALSNDLPARVVDVIVEFVYGPLAENPKRVGKPLRGDLQDRWSARRGDYHILYKINDGQVLVQVIDIGHRADVYRP